MINKTKILIVADSPALPTSGAEVVRLIFGELTSRQLGNYQLCQVGLSHSFAVAHPKWVVHPTKTVNGKDGEIHFAADDWHGVKTLREISPKFRPDIVFALNDLTGAAPLCSEPEDRQYKLILYLKIHDLPLTAQIGTILNRADFIVTMSEWSRSGLLSCCPFISPDKVDVMYSPADTARFMPLLVGERQELRQALLPDWMPRDAFILGWVGRPRWGKQIWLLYKVIHYLRCGKYMTCSSCGRVSLFDWDPLARCHLDESKSVLESRPGYKYDVCAQCGSPDVVQAEPLRDVFLWLHMPEDDPQAAWPLHWLEHEYGVVRNEDIYYTQGYGTKAAIAPADMPILYQLWDCLLYLSGAEGFGLPAWEAMCSALPVVYTNYSSHAEFLGGARAGLAVDGVLQPEGKGGSWRIIGDVSEAIAAVRRLYFDRELAKGLALNGRAFVQQYSLQNQAEQWHRIFQRFRSPEAVCQTLETDAGDFGCLEARAE